MISSRFAAAVVLLLGIASVPTVIHSYLGSNVVDGMSAGAVPVVLDGMRFTATGRKGTWVEEHFASRDWVERMHLTGGREVRLFVGRSYDAKRLYHHPELALLRGMATTPMGIGRAVTRPDVPLHVLATRRAGREGIAVYALLHDGKFVERPLLFQLRTSAALLFSGRKAMTLFLAADLSGRPAAIEDAPATRVLLAAIDAFETQSHTRNP